MTEHLIPIPGPSLERLRLAYTNFEQLAVVISEALGLDSTITARIDLPRGAFVIVEDDPVPNGLEAYEAARDGVT